MTNISSTDQYVPRRAKLGVVDKGATALRAKQEDGATFARIVALGNRLGVDRTTGTVGQ